MYFQWRLEAFPYLWQIPSLHSAWVAGDKWFKGKGKGRTGYWRANDTDLDDTQPHLVQLIPVLKLFVTLFLQTKASA